MLQALTHRHLTIISNNPYTKQVGTKDARSLLITKLGKRKHELFLDDLCSISKGQGLVPTPEILIGSEHYSGRCKKAQMPSDN